MTLAKINHDLFPSFNGLFDEMFNERTRNVYGTLPKVNIQEDDNGYSIELAAPGLKKGDFNIEIDDHVMTISSEQQEEHSDEKYAVKEFSYRSFRRSFTLPKIADSEKVKASYKEGILSVSIPKKEQAKPKSITVG